MGKRTKLASGRGRVLRLRGVKVHNLRNLHVDIPLGALTALAGVSGSGKSSLAMDTLFAEGRRRYVECLSTYTRQFLDRLDRPDIEGAEGIPPAIAVERKPPSWQARSTVGTSTEIHDLLRYLFARFGVPHCLACRSPIRPHTVTSATDAVIATGGRGVIGFEWETPGDRAAWGALRERLQENGFRRVHQAGSFRPIDRIHEPPPSVRVAVDRIPFLPERRGRIAEAFEIAFHFGGDRSFVAWDGADGEIRSFSRRMECPRCGSTARPPEPNLFSPNSPLGACVSCKGFGRIIDLDMEKVVPDSSRTLMEHPVEPWNRPAYASAYRELRRAGRRVGLPWDVPWNELSEDHLRFVEHGDDRGFSGIRGFFRWLEKRTYKVHVRVFLSRYRAYVPCDACGGTRLSPESLAVLVDGRHIGEVASWSVDRAREWVEGLTIEGALGTAADALRDAIARRLEFLQSAGLGYLSLDRPSRTLSGGEAQRIHLARCLGSGLVETLYVLDEPSVGLHAADVDRLLTLLRRLRDLGNTVLLVEHDPALLGAADHLIELGPGAGKEGGRIVFEGPPEGLVSARTPTGDYLSGRLSVAAGKTPQVVGQRGWLRLEGVRTHNLHDVDARFPLGCWTVVTGVSGSGKSSLVQDTLHGAVARQMERRDVEAGPYRRIAGHESLSGVELVDQSPIGKTPRSNPATYLGIFTEIRKRLASTPMARSAGVRPGYFSFNVPGGRCEACEGAGASQVEMHFLPDVLVTCGECEGRRFSGSALQIRWRGLNVVDILRLSVQEAAAIFHDLKKVAFPLRLLEEAGLGYLSLGQPAPTLSGGEAQRLKLVSRIARSAEARGRLLLLDEPTAGLHLKDLASLVALLRRLVREGDTVVCVEHHLGMIAAADWIIDLGPGAGPRGGLLIAEGPPEAVAASEGPTGLSLRAYVPGPRP